MKVFSLVSLLMVATVSAKGSGPYLPSGWRPQGPAFLLPTEREKVPAISPEDLLIQESEASGSDFLREYGPPKVQVSEDLIQQGLPDVSTEQPFVVIEAKFKKEDSNTGASEVVSEQNTVEEEIEATTDSQILVEEKITTITTESLVQGKSTNNEIQTTIDESSKISIQEEATKENDKIEVTKNVEITEQATKNENNNIESVVEERVGVTETDVKEGRVNNIADALVNLEKEIKDEHIRTNLEAELKTVHDTRTPQVPEGFLEYGPPGFREYGPPHEFDIRSAVVTEEKTTSKEAVENNEARRRRFSPKFRPSLKRKH